MLNLRIYFTFRMRRFPSSWLIVSYKNTTTFNWLLLQKCFISLSIKGELGLGHSYLNINNNVFPVPLIDLMIYVLYDAAES